MEPRTVMEQAQDSTNEQRSSTSDEKKKKNLAEQNLQITDMNNSFTKLKILIERFHLD